MTRRMPDNPEYPASALALCRQTRSAWVGVAPGETDLELVALISNAGERVWEEWEKVHYEATPLFQICAEKKSRTQV